MAQLEDKTDNTLQEEPENAVETENKTETVNDTAAGKDTGLQGGEQSEEDASMPDAFDITRKFKHGSNPIPSQGQAAAREPQQEREIPKKRALVGVTDKKVETKRILYFLALCFGVPSFRCIRAVMSSLSRRRWT